MTTIVELNYGDVFEWEGKHIQVQDQTYVWNGKVISLNCAPEGKSFCSDDCIVVENVPVMTEVKVIKPATEEMIEALELLLFGPRQGV